MFHYQQYDGLGLAQLVKQGEITSAEILEIAIQRVEQLNPDFNCITQKLYDRARQTIKQGIAQGPFQGVPFLLKDLGISYKQTVTTQGSALYHNNKALLNSHCTTRFQNAGLVIFGKTNTPELGLSFTTEPMAFGACRNPWDPQRTPGGSSGGAACAVALGITPLAHASDGGGSIRIPASCCGLFGFKPTRGLISAGPESGETWDGLATPHVITRSVRDSAAALDAIAGPALGDPYFTPVATSAYQSAIKIPPKSLKIAFCPTLLNDRAVEPSIQRSLKQTARLCEDLGHHVEQDYPQFEQDKLSSAFLTVVASNVRTNLKAYQDQRNYAIERHELEPITWAFLRLSEQYSNADYIRAKTIVQRESRKIARFFTRYDVLLSSTNARLPVPLGQLAGNTEDLQRYNERQSQFSPNTAIANMTGQPAMSVPLGWSEQSLPIGSHFLAPFGADALLFQLARQLEWACPWFHSMPSI